MRIAVCRPQVPFARGGVEIFTDDLVSELRARGHEADLVTVPFKWYPGERVLTQAFLWRLLDLDEADGRSVDLVVATKFPSYAIRHPRKVVWLLHQFRQAYELARGRQLDGRAEFVGRVDERDLADLYARCLAVYYAPVDEDFGMVPYEAFLSQKPVVTTTDAGGPLEVVADRRTGIVCEPRPRELAQACAWLREHVDDARAWGQAGKDIARRISWD